MELFGNFSSEWPVETHESSNPLINLPHENTWSVRTMRIAPHSFICHWNEVLPIFCCFRLFELALYLRKETQKCWKFLNLWRLWTKFAKFHQLDFFRRFRYLSKNFRSPLYGFILVAFYRTLSYMLFLYICEIFRKIFVTFSAFRTKKKWHQNLHALAKQDSSLCSGDVSL